MTVISEARPDQGSPWFNHGAALAAVILLIVVEFHDVLNAALQVWIVSPTYSHCFLVIPIVAWLVWEKRAALRALRPTIAPRFVWLIPLLVLVWWLGELSAINEVRQYAVIGLIQVAIVTFLGIEILQLIWFPVLFLLFLVPTGEYLIAPMQHFAARFVDISLNLLNIPHYTEGTTFELTNGRFEIAEACAGLRFLIATVTLGVLFCYLMYRKIYKVMLFLAASVIVPLIGNGLRCVGIIVLAHYTNNAYGAGADHIVYGWGFNVAILLILIFLGSRFRDEAPQASIGPNRSAGRDTPQALAIVLAAAVVLISAGPAYAKWRDSRPALPDMTAASSFLIFNGWRADAGDGDWQPQFPGADASVKMVRTAIQGGLTEPVELFVAYYSRPRTGHTVTAHLNQAWDERSWNAASNVTVSAALAQSSVVLQESQINSGIEKRLVWSVYWVDGKFTPSVLSVKLLQTKAAFEGREGQGFVALSTPVTGPVEDARARLADALSRLGPLSGALSRANQSSPQVPGGAR